MTSAHLLFIPGVLLVGVVFGFIIGGRVARDAMQMELKREAERQKAREDRAARKKARAAAKEADAPST